MPYSPIFREVQWQPSISYTIGLPQWLSGKESQDPLEDEMATCSSILAGKKTLGQRSLAGCSTYGLKEIQLSTLRSTGFTTGGHLFSIYCLLSDRMGPWFKLIQKFDHKQSRQQS